MRHIVLTAIAVGVLLVGVSAWAQTCSPRTPDDNPASRYRVNADGTARDLRTGLMWMRCAVGQTWEASSKTCRGQAKGYTWKEALQAAQNLNRGSGFAGYADWRVPNLRELASIERFHCSNPAINLEVFPNTPSRAFWSSTPLEGFRGQAWSLNFATSHVIRRSMRNQFALRLVRSGAYPITVPSPATAPTPANVVN